MSGRTTQKACLIFLSQNAEWLTLLRIAGKTQKSAVPLYTPARWSAKAIFYMLKIKFMGERRCCSERELAFGQGQPVVVRD
jgi:hypothetical protein